jgi:hypothetical protein
VGQLDRPSIWTPLDVLKSRLQTGREGTSAVALTKKIIRDEGWTQYPRIKPIQPSSRMIFFVNATAEVPSRPVCNREL